MNFSVKQWRVFTNFWFFLRFIIPLYVFINPYVGVFLSLLLDGPDGYFSFKTKRSWVWYHTIDKTADYWWYILILVYSLINKLPILNYILILFLLRTIGQFISLGRRKSQILVFFPNILENYFIAYLLFGKSLLMPPFSMYVWTICILIAVFREYLVHIKKAYAANYLFKLGIDWKLNE